MEWARRQHRRGNGASTAVVGALLVLLVGAILATGYEYRHRESRLDLRLQLREEAAQAANLGARVLIAAGDYSVNRKGAREDRRSLLEALDAFRTSRLADSARFAVDPTDEDLSRRIRSLVLFERESAGRIEFAVDNLLRADALNLRRARGAAVDRAVGGYAEAAEGLLLAADRSLDSQLDASWIRLAIFSLVLGAAPLGLFACFLAWNRRLKLSLQESLQTAAEMAEVNEHLETAKAELQEQRAELEAALDQANGQSELFEHASIRFQQLFGGLPVGCLTFDSMGLIQEWNLEMTELTGLEGYMACYHPLTSVFPAASRDFIEAMVRQVTTDGERVNFDSKLVRTGVEVRAHMVAYPLRNGRGEILGGILAGLNITAREEARESLRISEQRLETAMAATGAGHFEWDLKTDSVYWSPRIFEILATTPEETTPVRNFMIDRMHPEDGHRARIRLSEHMAGRRPSFDIEARVQRVTGDFVWVHLQGRILTDAEGRPDRMTGTLQDIHQRKSAELALKASEQRFRDVTDAAGEFVFELNADGVITFLTHRAEEVLGRQVRSFLGRKIVDLAPAQRRKAAGRIVNALQSRRGQVVRSVMPYNHPDGRERILSISGAAIVDETGRSVGFRGTGLDITDQKQAEAALAKANTMLFSILESIRDAFFGLDASLNFTYVNGAAAEMFGVQEADILGRSLWTILPSGQEQAFRRRLDEVHRTQQGAELELPMTDTMTWMHFRIYPFSTGYTVFAQDITERKTFEARIEAQMVEINEKNTMLEIQQLNLEEANRRLSALASSDGLTGLKNHKAFHEALAQAMRDIETTGAPLSLIMLDVDEFKSYNDTFGHPSGDDVLRAVGQVLTLQGRRTDVIARYGGEEFALLMPGTTREDAQKAAERIRLALQDYDWPRRPVTVSLGVASIIGAESTGTELLTRADAALYASKNMGRNRVTVYGDWIGRRAA